MKTIIIIFFIYTLFGSIFEHASYFIGKKMFHTNTIKTVSNPILIGFPLYGLGGLLIWYSYKYLFFSIHPILLFLIYGSLITLIEFIIGKYIVDAGISIPITLNNKSLRIVPSWDYHREPLNYQGLISMRHFITWGVLSLIIIKLHPILEKKINCN